tara:strand:- start:2034 stop:2435 length:402 start_codon:yes stop_codon:yes gene_type:complete
MRKKTELSYTIKIKIYFLLILNLLKVLFIFKFRDFEYLIKFLKSNRTKKNVLQVDEKSIFYREKKLSKLLKINKCLVTSAYLYKTLRDLGFKAELFIGIKKDHIFSSHAWVEGSDKSLIDEQNKLFKEIIRFN